MEPFETPAKPDRGMSESVSWAVLMPVIMVCLLGFIQGAVWVNGRTTVTNAALTAAESYSLLGASSDDAQLSAIRIATTGGLSNISVTTSVDGKVVRVTVSATVPSFFGDKVSRVSATAARPMEMP